MVSCENIATHRFFVVISYALQDYSLLSLLSFTNHCTLMCNLLFNSQQIEG